MTEWVRELKVVEKHSIVYEREVDINFPAIIVERQYSLYPISLSITIEDRLPKLSWIEAKAKPGYKFKVMVNIAIFKVIRYWDIFRF